MSDHSDLIETFRRLASETKEASDSVSDGDLVDQLIVEADLWKQAADAIEALRASLANEQRAREECESRNVFLETEIVQLAERVRKS